MRDAVAKKGNGAREKKRERERRKEDGKSQRHAKSPVDAAAAVGRDGRGRMDPFRSDHPEQ